MQVEVEPWQIPVLVMAAIAGSTSIFWLIGWMRDGFPDASQGGSKPQPDPDPDPKGRTKRELSRTMILAVLTITLLGIFFTAAGAETTNIFAEVASAISILVSAVLTVQSFLLLQGIQREQATRRDKDSGNDQQDQRTSDASGSSPGGLLGEGRSTDAEQPEPPQPGQQ